MEGTSRELRFYWARFNELLIKDGILGLLNNSDDGVTTTFRAIVPKRARQKILEIAHSSAGGTHFRVQKTVNKPKQRFHWNLMTRDVRDWCEKCPTCNRHKTQQQNRATIQPIYTGEPFDVWRWTLLDHYLRQIVVIATFSQLSTTLRSTSRHMHLQTKKPRQLRACSSMSSCLGMESRTCYTPIKALNSNQICSESFGKCSISKRRELLRTTRNAMDKWSA